MSDSGVTSRRSKTALVLAGGGVTGAAYEIGALRALDDLLYDFGVNDFDVFIGTSAGSLVASCLVNGLTPHELMRHLETPLDDIAPLNMGDLFTLNGRDILAQGLYLPQVILRAIQALTFSRKHLSLLDLIEAFALALPGGLYDISSLDRYLGDVLSRPGRTNDFRRLTRELVVIATDLDTGARVVFGVPPYDDVPISRAVAASSAMPLVYRPVRIGDRDYVDGSVRGNASLDLAIERGARLIVCVNPLVPYDLEEANNDDELHIRDMGAPGIVNQVFRTLFHSALHYHLKQIHRRHPDVDIVLIEPARDDVRMFSEMPMRYSSRTEVARHGFETVARFLYDRHESYRNIFARHGITLQRRQAAERLATVAHNINVQHPGPRDLRNTLAHLERLLEQRQQ
jgi:predicted acylesterase/phospholipase RssA